MNILYSLKGQIRIQSFCEASMCTQLDLFLKSIPVLKRHTHEAGIVLQYLLIALFYYYSLYVNETVLVGNLSVMVWSKLNTNGANFWSLNLTRDENMILKSCWRI